MLYCSLLTSSSNIIAGCCDSDTPPTHPSSAYNLVCSIVVGKFVMPMMGIWYESLEWWGQMVGRR